MAPSKWKAATAAPETHHYAPETQWNVPRDLKLKASLLQMATVPQAHCLGDPSWRNIDCKKQAPSVAAKNKVTHSAAETKQFRCPSFSSRTSRVRASPVDCSPITMHCTREMAGDTPSVRRQTMAKVQFPSTSQKPTSLKRPTRNPFFPGLKLKGRLAPKKMNMHQFCFPNTFFSAFRWTGNLLDLFVPFLIFLYTFYLSGLIFFFMRFWPEHILENLSACLQRVPFSLPFNHHHLYCYGQRPA